MAKDAALFGERAQQMRHVDAVPKEKDDGIYYAKKCNGDPMCVER